MHGLVYHSGAPQGLFSSLIYSQDDASSIILRECSHHRSPFWLAKVEGKPSYVMQWLQDAQIDPNLSGNSSDEEEDEEEEEEEEDENDLADMVHDFIENGSCCQINNNGFFSSDSDKAGASVQAPPTTAEAIQAIIEETSPVEREILSHLAKLAFSASNTDLICPGEDCKGGCLEAMAVKYLRRYGYKAYIYTSKWQSNGKLPGGEYRYIDVPLDAEEQEDQEEEEEGIIRRRVIVDLDFRSQFEIARPVIQYTKALRSLPRIFVGREEQLEQILILMSKAAKSSLNQNAMHLPPWRTLDYMRAKWLTRYGPDEPQPHLFTSLAEKQSHVLHSQCQEQLNRFKELAEEYGTTLILKSITNDGGDGIW